MVKVFVYGTLKPGEVNYQRYCAGHVISEQTALTQGQIYALPLGYPAMTLGEGTVYGYLLTFTSPNILSQLDVLEGYDPKKTVAENEYNRCEREVFDLEGKSLGLAWVYLMTQSQVKKLDGMFLAHGWWENHCQ